MKRTEGASTLNNVRNNNNIAARNIAYKVIDPVTDDRPDAGNGTGPRTVWTLVQNARNFDTIINVQIATDIVFAADNYGDVLLYMDDEFFSLFASAGYQITGAVQADVNEQVYRMTDHVVTISGLYFSANTKANLGFDFIPDTALPGKFSFDIAQWSIADTLLEGGATVQLEPIPGPPILGKRDLMSAVQQKQVMVPSFSLYPNPNQGVVYLRVVLPESGDFSAVLMNNLGQEIASIEQSQLKAGVHSFPFDMSSLAAGVYYCEMRSVNTMKMEKVVLQK